MSWDTTVARRGSAAATSFNQAQLDELGEQVTPHSEDSASTRPSSMSWENAGPSGRRRRPARCFNEAQLDELGEHRPAPLCRWRRQDELGERAKGDELTREAAVLQPGPGEPWLAAVANAVPVRPVLQRGPAP